MAERYGGLFPDLGLEDRRRRRGVLPYEDIKLLIENHQVVSGESIEESQVQPASLDLRLGGEAIQVRASFLPGKNEGVLDALQGLEVQRLDLTDGAVLQKGSVYIIPLQESLHLGRNTLAKANPKSTTGRLDVLARLITDRAEQFDGVARGYRGPLFAEIAPKTFNVRVTRGSRINQMRFLRGVPSHSDTSRKAASLPGVDLVYDERGEPMPATVLRGLWFSVDLKGPSETEVIGWKALRDAPVIDLERVDYYDPAAFWETVVRPRSGRLILNPDDFYILGSKERVRVPPSYAAEMVPYDPSMGEFRVHYAGFFDPGFGYGTGEVRGTRAILEVRSHEVPYALRDGQHVGRLIYEPLLAAPGKLYGQGAGSSYQHQQLGLSRQFRQPAI
jgi:dCTP deaminase